MKKMNANVSSLTDRGYSVVGRYICLVVTVEAISSELKCMQMMANGREVKLLYDYFIITPLKEVSVLALKFYT
jgi:hypothetical protein